MAFGPSADRPVLVEIGKNTQTFLPNTAVANYSMDFVLDRDEKTINIYPSSPTSPASLNYGNEDNRRLGIGLVELKLIWGKNSGPPFLQLQSSRWDAPSETDVAFWEGLYSQWTH